MIKKNKEKTPKPVNDLSLKVFDSLNKELINENGCTVVCLLMQKDGNILTSFMGDYNKEILKTMQKVNKEYFKALIKKLYGKNSNQGEIKNETKSKNNVKKNDAKKN
jgi:glycosylphosphatidylinositol transamidase (GPIT) subunit GPI8